MMAGLMVVDQKRTTLCLIEDGIWMLFQMGQMVSGCCWSGQMHGDVFSHKNENEMNAALGHLCAHIG